jgi:SAM-dependent methyltransferase
MAEKHFYEQVKHSENYLIPYLKKHIPDFGNSKILEVGCAEAGFLKQLVKMGIDATGLEISSDRVKIAKKKVSEAQIFLGDITDPDIVNKLNGPFDLIVMRDVIEHIPNRPDVFLNINKMLKTKGFVYITFPPKYSGFAGHQQNAESFIKYVPYLHLLPATILKFSGKLLKEKDFLMKEIIANYKYGLTINSFEKFCRGYNFKFKRNDLFLFRPIFKIRFGLPIIRFPNIPLFREFFAFGGEYLIQKG